MVAGGLRHRLAWCFWLWVVVVSLVLVRDEVGYDIRLVVRPTAKPSVMGTKMAIAGEAKTWLGRVSEGMNGNTDIAG